MLPPRVQVEEKALEKEKDKQSRERLAEVQRELGELGDQLKPLQMRYRAEKAALDEIKKLAKKKEELQIRLEQAENCMDLAMVADIKYGEPGGGGAGRAAAQAAQRRGSLAACSATCSRREEPPGLAPALSSPAPALPMLPPLTEQRPRPPPCSLSCAVQARWQRWRTY